MKKLLAIAFVVLLAACQPNNTAVKTTQQNTYTPSFVVDYQKVLLQFQSEHFNESSTIQFKNKN